jgi:TolB protein
VLNVSRPISSLATGCVVALTALGVASPGAAEFPGRAGRIAFMERDPAGRWQVWTASAKLRSKRQLTSSPGDSGWAAWSPDGSRVAFDSNRADPNHKDRRQINDVFVMNTDGSGVRKLTHSKGSSADAAWSPDGSLIAFDSDHGDYPAGQGIYLLASDGRYLRRVTRLAAGAANDSAPRFSPDGKRLVFTRYRGTGRAERAALFTVRLDGSDLRQLTSFAIHAGDADWSPDGTRIVFEAYPNPDSYGDIYVIASTGGPATNLTRNPVGQAGSADPVWSPEGRKILFLDNRRVGGMGTTGLATMTPAGASRKFISTTNLELHQPDWESVG